MVLMKDFVKFILSDIMHNIAMIMSIVGFIIAVLVPDINKYILTVSISWTIIFSVFLVGIGVSIYKYISTRLLKCMKFIEIKKTEQDNDIYWFSSAFSLNVGDTIKLCEYGDKGIPSFVCIAKVQDKDEQGHVGLLPFEEYKALGLIKSNKVQTKNIIYKPKHINSDDIMAILNQVSNTHSVKYDSKETIK